jgi:hypothetical protein
VRVAVESELYAGVPRQVLNELGMHAPAEKQSEARVPEVVPANFGQPCAPEQRLEVAVDNVLRIERCPFGGGEDEPRVLVRAAGPELLLELALEGCQRPKVATVRGTQCSEGALRGPMRKLAIDER